MKNRGTDYTRREFLATSTTGLVSVGLVSLSPRMAFGQDVKESAERPEAEIIYRQLGKTGLKLPIVSQGAGACNDAGVIQASYELGVRHFDTAANYQFGANEQLVGDVVRRMGVRNKVAIASKIYTPRQRRNLNEKQAKKKLATLLEGSLRRLRTDYVDILYIHDVSTTEIVNDPVITETMKHLKRQGKVRYIGFSTHANMTEVLNEVARTGAWDVVLTSINFTMADDTDLLKAIANAAKKGVGIIGMKVMAGGSRWPNPDSRREYSSSTIATASLKWVLRNENITTVIPGYNNHQHMKEDFSVAGNLEYTEEESNLLSDNSIKLGMGFCRQCRTCLASCPRDVDIPTLMRTHMYAAQYANFHLARATLDDIPRQNSLRTCSSCDICVAQCANTVDIRRRIEELKVMYA